MLTNIRSASESEQSQEDATSMLLGCHRWTSHLQLQEEQIIPAMRRFLSPSNSAIEAENAGTPQMLTSPQTPP